MKYEDLTPEQQAKAKACTGMNDLVALASEEGMELTEEQLDSISGGEWYDFCTDYDDGNSKAVGRPAD